MSEQVLVIDRTKWRRGGDGRDREFGPTLLRNGLGFMCCLGFDALAYGVPDHRLHYGDPAAMATRRPDFPLSYVEPRCISIGQTDTGHPVYRNTTAVSCAVAVNDDPDLPDAEREARLIPLLKQIGGYADVQFIN